MINHSPKLMALLLVGALSATAAVSKYSGIYEGRSQDGVKFQAAITKGGRVAGFGDESEGLSDALDPARSTIKANGKIKAAADGGFQMVARVNSKYRLIGTFKDGGQTMRATAKRTYK